MRNSIICITTAVGLLVSSAVTGLAQDGERVLLRNLPDQVKKTIRAQQGDEDVQRVNRITHDGKTFYEVQIDRDRNPKIFVAEDGALITGTAATALRNRTTTSARDSRLAELPTRVQQTFKREAGSATISDIDKETVGGRTVYEIEFTEAGKRDEIHINENGTIVRERLSRQGRDQERDSAVRGRDSAQATAGFDRPLAATKKVEFESLPAAVKQTVREEAGSNRIDDAERGTLDGRVVYEIAFKENGEHNELRVDENGGIVQRVAGTNIRFPGALSVNEVPAPVRRAIESQVGSGEVNDIDKKTVDGKTVYEVGFKKRSGAAQQEIQIAEDGTVIGEPAGAEKQD